MCNGDGDTENDIIMYKGKKKIAEYWEWQKKSFITMWQYIFQKLNISKGIVCFFKNMCYI